MITKYQQELFEEITSKARETVLRDGFHQALMFLVKEGKDIKIVDFSEAANSPEAKTMLGNQMKELAKQGHIDTMIMISEANLWITAPENRNKCVTYDDVKKYGEQHDVLFISMSTLDEMKMNTFDLIRDKNENILDIVEYKIDQQYEKAMGNFTLF